MNKKLYTEERRNEILRIIREQKSVSVEELIHKYNVSGTTIRLDLTALEGTGYITRTHGGAVLTDEPDYPEKEPSISERKNDEEKAQIARAAMSLLKPDETILLDTGTTIAAFARVLTENLSLKQTIYSNDLSILQILENAENYNLHMLGGPVRSGFHYTYGVQVQGELAHYHFNKFFLATSAFSNGELSTATSDLASLKKSMIDSAEEVILLADSTKFNHVAFQKFADLSDIQIIITDNGVSDSTLDMIKSKGVDIIIV